MNLYTDIPCPGCEWCIPMDPPCSENLCDGTGLRKANSQDIIKAAKTVEEYVVLHNELYAQLNLFDPPQRAST